MDRHQPRSSTNQYDASTNRYDPSTMRVRIASRLVKTYYDGPTICRDLVRPSRNQYDLTRVRCRLVRNDQDLVRCCYEPPRSATNHYDFCLVPIWILYHFLLFQSLLYKHACHLTLKIALGKCGKGYISYVVCFAARSQRSLWFHVLFSLIIRAPKQRALLLYLSFVYFSHFSCSLVKVITNNEF